MKKNYKIQNGCWNCRYSYLYPSLDNEYMCTVDTVETHIAQAGICNKWKKP